MGLLKKILNKNDASTATSSNSIEVTTSGNTIKLGDIGSITIGSPTVGDSTGSDKTDFYVYEWFIKDTEEVFYVGKGRGNRYKDHHNRPSEVEKICEQYDTDVRFVAENLTEDQALELETDEISRILNDTEFCLANRIVPYFTRRDSGYSKSRSTPPLQFETAPIIYASELDEHYFGIKGKPFDPVEYEKLSHVFIIEGVLTKDETDIIYGGNYERYYGSL